MSGKYLLGFDIGTSESKGTITDIEGHVLATASKAHGLITPEPGFAEHDPIKDWEGDFKTVVAELLLKSGAKADEIAGIGISAIMAGIVFTDENYNPLRNAILYGIDSRCVPQCRELDEKIGEARMMEKYNTLHTVDHFGPKILWVRENEPEIYAKAKHITIDAGYLVAQLTGVNVVDKYSVDAAFPMINPVTTEWDDEFLGLVCDKELLPEIRKSTAEVVGKVTKKGAEKFGLAEGIPVITGTTDAGAEAVSVGVINPGDTMIMYGSTAFFVSLRSTESGPKIPGEACYTIDGNYCGALGMATTGSLTKWLRDVTAIDYKNIEAGGGDNAYVSLFKEAQNIPAGSDGLIILPYFQGERSPLNDPKAKGVMFGLKLGHTRGHLVHAAFEGIGYGIDQNMEILKSRGYVPNNVTAVGGGTKTPLWIQTVSDICGFAQKVPEVTVGASYGDALLAGLAVGAISKASDISDLVKIKYIAEPDMKKHEQYKEYKEIFKELYTRNKDLMHRL